MEKYGHHCKARQDTKRRDTMDVHVLQNTFQIESILAQTFYVFGYTQTPSNKELKPKWHGWITLEEFQIDMLIN